MTPERFHLLEEVFHGALDQPSERRADYVRGACNGDTDLRRGVMALLDQHEPGSTFLEPPSLTERPASSVGQRTRVGRYEIVRLIAAGGMGTVYEAVQEKPSRSVALKVMRGGLASESARRRFEFESQVLASLRHPGIAQVYEAGVHEDLGGAVPYFAMELVNGPTLVEHCRRQKLEIPERLRLFKQVCDAVQHAHQRGVIHRDIKPSNILVEAGEGGEAGGAPAVPKVIDFGIARSISGDTPAVTIATETGRVIGTLAYMSPEQCAGSSRGADTRSDVYSLGVVLYELLCGGPPYDVADRPLPEVARIITSQPPLRPSEAVPALKGDIETIVLKALEKEPERRYQSAGDLGRDVERCLSHQPIEARPATALYQIRMFARRHRAVVAAAAAVALTMVAATAISTWFAVAARHEAERAEGARARAQKTADFLQGAVASANPWFPPAFPEHDRLADYEPFDEWQHSPWPYAGLPGRGASVADVVMAACERVENEFADDPETRARLSDSLGWTLQRLLTTERHPEEKKMLARVQVLLRGALRTRRELLGSDHEDTQRSTMRLAESLDYTDGGQPEAGVLYDEVWRNCRRVYGPHDARTLHCLRAWANNRAFLLGGLDEAIARLREEVGWAKAPDAEATAPVYITLAYASNLVSWTDRKDEAKEMGLRALDGLVGLVGEDNIRTGFATQYVADTMVQCQDYEKAEELMWITVRNQSGFFGSESLEVAYRLHSLAEILGKRGKWQKAAEVCREAYRIFIGIRGRMNYDTVSTQWSLAEALWNAGMGLPESEELAIRAYRAWIELYHPADGTAMKWASQLLAAGITNRDFERAREFAEEQIGYAESETGNADWAAVFRRFHAQTLIGLERFADAGETLRAGLKFAEEHNAKQVFVVPLRELLDEVKRCADAPRDGAANGADAVKPDSP